VTQVKELANLPREIEQEVPAERVAHRITTGVGKEYEAVKVAIRARRGALTVDWVEQQLLANEVEKNEDDDQKPSTAPIAMSVSTQYTINPHQINPGSMHGPTAVAMAAGDPQQQHIQVQCILKCVCSSTLYSYPIPSNGPQHSVPQNNFRQYPYTRPNTNTTSQCPVCQQFGYTEDTCWSKHPELKPR